MDKVYVRSLINRGPLCPLDVPAPIWEAVAKQYESEDDWAPGPNYHTEYRDTRIAYQATLEHFFGLGADEV